MVKHKKPSAFFDSFDRKGGEAVADRESTHYCPGCGHGIVHKLVAEAVDDLGVQERTVFLSPVGCAVYGYHYFDTGNIHCAHGRAPAVGTGVARTLVDAVVIVYQGDGDLAGSGISEIVHAANRGENLAVFFINNAVYGISGGQMSPATIPGQKTLTTPGGRIPEVDGAMLGVAEIIDSLIPPVYIERTSLGSADGVMQTRRAVRKAVSNQMNGAGFSFVEVLSPCPAGWKVSPLQARTWIREEMEKACGVRVFRDVDSAGDGTGRGAQAGSGPRGNGGSAGSLRGRAMSGFMDDMELPELLNVNHEEKINPVNTLKSDSRVVISGRSGQGVVSAGILLANAAVHEGLEAVMLPSYGPQTRGGAARADIVVSAEPGASPVFTKPTALLALDAASLDEYEDSVEKGGLIIVNSSLAGRRIRRRDVNVIYAPVNAMAEKSGYVQGANIIMLSVYLLFTGTPCLATLKDVVPKSINRKELMDVSLKLVESAEDFFGPDVTVYPES